MIGPFLPIAIFRPPVNLSVRMFYAYRFGRGLTVGVCRPAAGFGEVDAFPPNVGI